MSTGDGGAMWNISQLLGEARVGQHLVEALVGRGGVIFGGLVASPASSKFSVTPRRAQNCLPLTSPARPMTAHEPAAIAAAAIAHRHRRRRHRRHLASSHIAAPRLVPSWPVSPRLVSELGFDYVHHN